VHEGGEAKGPVQIPPHFVAAPNSEIISSCSIWL